MSISLKHIAYWQLRDILAVQRAGLEGKVWSNMTSDEQLVYKDLIDEFIRSNDPNRKAIADIWNY